MTTYRIGTKVIYQLPPRGRRKKKSVKKTGIVVGVVAANMEPRANLDTILFVGWKDYKDLSLTKEIDESPRDAESFLVMDEESSKVYWPNAEDVLLYEYHVLDQLADEPVPEEDHDDNPLSEMDMADGIDPSILPDDLDERIFEDMVTTLSDEEKETVVVDEPE